MIEILHATFRGTVGAMAMTGLRLFADHAGIIREAPPNRFARKRGRGLLKRIPRNRRRPAVELVHWTTGALAGALFALLPEALRRRAWAGPAYGMAVWLGFDTIGAPALGLTDRGWPRARERAVFLLDHLMFGLVLSEMRVRPRE
jgi:hypothetical protein